MNTTKTGSQLFSEEAQEVLAKKQSRAIAGLCKGMQLRICWQLLYFETRSIAADCYFPIKDNCHIKIKNKKNISIMNT